MSFPLDLVDNYTAMSTSNAWHVPPSLWLSTRPINTTNFTWVDISSYSDNDRPGASLGALITLPITTIDDAPTGDTTRELPVQSALIPCLINAKWAAVKINYEPRSRSEIIHNITNPSGLDLADGRNTTEASRRRLGLSDTISISPQWAALLNVAGMASSSAMDKKLNATMMQVLLQQFAISDIYARHIPYINIVENITIPGTESTGTILQTVLGAVVAEGLSRQTYYSQTLANFSGSTFDESGTPVGFTIKRYGYGFGYQDTSTVIFGLAVLLTHAVVAFAYILHSLYHRVAGTGFTSSAWGEMGEMLALALHSGRATALQNVGGGVAAKSTWRMRVRVRERRGDCFGAGGWGEGSRWRSTTAWEEV